MQSTAVQRMMSMDEKIELAAVDGVFYSHEFFPKTFRQNSPPLHYFVWSLLDDPEEEFVALEMFRGSAKTTLARCGLSKRFAYRISKVALAVSAAQAHSIRTVRWMKRQVEFNKYWANTFGLYAGKPWTDEEIKIIWRPPGGEPIQDEMYLLAAGMRGQTRGVNLDDWRPDLIMVDDPCDEENTGTAEQREKTSNLFFGSLQQGLAPKSEQPHSKMLLLQTGLNKADLIHQCHDDPTWRTVKLGCYDKNKESTWPERFPTHVLDEKKLGFVGRGQIHLWLREMECKIVSSETAAFNSEQFVYYDERPAEMTTFIGIDPATDSQKIKTAHKSAIYCIGVSGGKVYDLEHYAQQSKNPEEIWNAFHAMAMRWRPQLVGVETVAFQKMLAWYFRQKMRETSSYWPIREYNDRRRKPERIRQALSGRIQMGDFRIRRSNVELTQALTDYTDNVDIDILDALAIAIDMAFPQMMQEHETDLEGDFIVNSMDDERNIPDLDFIPACP